MAFQKAQKKNARLRLALSGTAGAGKTYTALLIAKAFGKKIAVMDSERGSSELYSDLVDFDVSNLTTKTVQEYREEIQAAARDGYDVLVIDSYSHSWISALETVDKMGGSKFSNGWKVVSPLVGKLVDDILSYPGHVIATMRTKADYAIENVNGKLTPKKLGMATVARDGTDYEFGVMLDLTVDGAISVSKSRCPTIPPASAYTREDLEGIIKRLKAWLGSGAARSHADEIAERIRFAASLDVLATLVEEIKTLDSAERAALGPIFLQKKRELAEVIA